MSSNNVKFPIYCSEELYIGPLSETEVWIIIGGVGVIVGSNFYLAIPATLGSLVLFIAYRTYKDKYHRAFLKHLLYSKKLVKFDSHVFVPPGTTWKG